MVERVRANKTGAGLAPADMRRSRRHARTLLVELLQNGQSTMLQSVDVGRHGLFVAHPNPPLERHVVMLNVHLPDGPIRATAVVSRVATHPRGVQGMGVQFFALAEDAKHRWDRFMADLDGAPAPAHGGTGRSDVASFYIKPRDPERLAAFHQDSVLPGRVELHTPLLKAVGSLVSLVVVHPLTHNEFVFNGVVEEVFQDKPKRMGVRVGDPTLSTLGAFSQWMKTGHAPPPPPSLPPLPPMTPMGRPPSMPPDAMWSVTAQFNQPTVEITGRAAVPAAMPSDAPEEEYVVEDDQMFVVEEEVDDTEENATPAAPVPSIPIIQGQLLPPPPPVAPAREMLVKLHEVANRLRAENALVRCWCANCTMPAATMDVGVPPGSMALFAEMRPMWCSHCRVLVSGLRIDPGAGRQRLLNLLGAELHTFMLGEVPLSFVYDAIALAQPPRCSWCGGWLGHSEGTQALDDRVWFLPPGGTQTLPPGVGDCCLSPAWHVERLARADEPAVAGSMSRAAPISSLPAGSLEETEPKGKVTSGAMEADGLLVFRKGQRAGGGN